MNKGQFMEQATILRHLVDEHSQRPEWGYLINRTNRTDDKAIRKLHIYLNQVFGRNERARRLTVLSILLGREIKTTNVLTLAEVFAFLSWMKYNGKALDTLTWAKENPKVARDSLTNLDAPTPEEALPYYVEDEMETHLLPF